jgi:ParB-like chromosome segregation protein Spo0J
LFSTDGAHRLEAAKRLGWTEIAALFPADGVDARLSEITQNLKPYEITVQERAEALAEYDSILREQELQAARGDNRFTMIVLSDWRPCGGND